MVRWKSASRRFSSWGSTAVLLLALTPGCDGVGETTARRARVIDHVVFIVKENRTFDTYFGAYTSPSGEKVDGVTTGKVGSFELPLPKGDDRGPYVMHEHWNALLAYNGGAMNGFFLVPVLYGAPFQFPSLASYAQYGRQDIPNYWSLADRFVLADRYFTSSMTSTFPNRLHTVAAQSAGLFQLPLTTQWNCSVKLPVAPVYREDCSTGFVAPCFEIPTLPDLLEEAGRTWRMYITPRDGDGSFNSLFAIRHMWDRAQSDPAYADEHFPPVGQLAEDAARDALPDVSWVVYPMEESEHAPEGPVCRGEEATTKDIWALMESPAWPRMLIVLTWNDWGGCYDHVPPPEPQVCPHGHGFYEPGFRVPAIFLSPYVRAGTVSHTVYEHASVLRAIEEIFDLGTTLHERDPRAKDSTVNSILDVLDVESPDFSVPARTMRTCPAAEEL